MIHPYAVAAFLLAILPLIATPGASLALLIQYVTAGGHRQALPVILGTVTGLYAHATLAIAGLSALVMHSSQALTAVKLLGAAYLVRLGLWTWRPTTLPPPPTPMDQPKRSASVYTQASGRSSCAEGRAWSTMPASSARSARRRRSSSSPSASEPSRPRRRRA
jgi:threonine/homoserine/homoserine lactone efflux protein